MTGQHPNSFSYLFFGVSGGAEVCNSEWQHDVNVLFKKQTQALWRFFFISLYWNFYWPPLNEESEKNLKPDPTNNQLQVQTNLLHLQVRKETAAAVKACRCLYLKARIAAATLLSYFGNQHLIIVGPVFLEATSPERVSHGKVFPGSDDQETLWSGNFREKKPCLVKGSRLGRGPS